MKRPAGKKNVIVQVDAMPLSGTRKEALVYEVTPQGKKFSLIADEGPHLGGEESAPTPLSYLTAGVAF